MSNDFAIFILSNGRPDRVYTYAALKKSGYTGPIYIVIDNEDKTAPQYQGNFGNRVIMFDKAAIAETFDEGDNFQDRRAVIYARNACFEIAKHLGITYFMQLDDDYYGFVYKTDDNFELRHERQIKNLDKIIKSMLDYYKSIPAKSLAMAQCGDFIGGSGNIIDESINERRKCMNSFICSTDRAFQFVGKMNEDVSTYTWFQSLGNLFLTFPLVAIHQKQTQSNKGGMSEFYKEGGAYMKPFYTVMYFPSSVKVAMLNSSHPRLHHKIDWDSTVPCILSEKYRKQKAGGNNVD